MLNVTYPVRVAKFIPRKQWAIAGADVCFRFFFLHLFSPYSIPFKQDMQIRVYNYNTTERIKTFEAHQDYIRSMAIHPTLPYLLTSSDDMTIKLWDWDKSIEFFF